jgi:hypothetical protein
MVIHMAEEASKEEQVGFHKGSLATLAKEREELLRIVGVVEQLMQMHVKALKELGVDLQKMAEDSSKSMGKHDPKKTKPIEHML